MPRRIDAKRVANGHSTGGRSCDRRTVVSFDDETHEQIRSIAIKKQCSFAEIVRQLVEHALHDYQ